MSQTVANQRTINIHRERVMSDFLGIKNENWMSASRVLGAHALRLYLYLASNKDNYNLALSPAAILKEIGMPKSTYQDQFQKLINLGYLVNKGGNHYDFFEIPQAVTHNKNNVTDNGYDFDDNTTCDNNNTANVHNKPSENIEINIDNTDKIINNCAEKQASQTHNKNKFIF